MISERSVLFVGREVLSENEEGGKSKWNKPIFFRTWSTEECLEVEKLKEDFRQKDAGEVCCDFYFH